jgi:hypothetical protein
MASSESLGARAVQKGCFRVPDREIELPPQDEAPSVDAVLAGKRLELGSAGA